MAIRQWLRRLKELGKEKTMSNKLFEFIQFCGNHSLKVILIMMIILGLLLIAMDFLSELSDVINGRLSRKPMNSFAG